MSDTKEDFVNVGIVSMEPFLARGEGFSEALQALKELAEHTGNPFLTAIINGLRVRPWRVPTKELLPKKDVVAPSGYSLHKGAKRFDTPDQVKSGKFPVEVNLTAADTTPPSGAVTVARVPKAESRTQLDHPMFHQRTSISDSSAKIAAKEGKEGKATSLGDAVDQSVNVFLSKERPRSVEGRARALAKLRHKVKEDPSHG